MQSYDARIMGDVSSPKPAACTASASQASVDHTVRMTRGVRSHARTEEPASKTHPGQTSTAAAVPCTSPDNTVRSNKEQAQKPRPAPICSASGIQGTECVMISVTTTNVSGTEETARSTGSSRGLTALPVFLAGICLRMESVIRSVTTQGASLTALSARRRRSARM